MKVRQRPLAVSILFLSILSRTCALPKADYPPIPTIPSAEYAAAKSELGITDVDTTLSSPPSKASAGSYGTKDAPVDGKDGLPHEGPFIETAAERDRKEKAKENGEELTPPPVKKPGPKDSNYLGGWGDTATENLPDSNDGVMDDPNRPIPEEGTRGTGGGITEKNRKGEKTPEKPKEAPPLPHSEQEKLRHSEKATTKLDKTEKSKDKVKDKIKEKPKEEESLAGLTVGRQLTHLSIHAD